MTMTRRRLLDDTFKKSVVGNPAIATDSLARMYPGIVMDGWTTQDGTPTPEAPVPIVSAGTQNQDTRKWEYEIAITNAQTDPDKNQTVTLTADRPLTKWDKLEKRNGQWGWVYKSAEIESYTDESVPGEYYSTTGQLSTGAQVWYETTTETFVPLTTAEQEAMNSLYTYRPTTVLTNQQGCQMALTYKARKNLVGYNLLNYEDLTNIEKWIGKKGNSYCHFDIELKRNKKYRLSVVENNMNADYYAEHSGLPAATFYVGENENTFTGNTCFGSTTRGQSGVLTEYEFQTTENLYYFNLYLPSVNWNADGLHIVFDQLLIGIKLQEVN